MHKCLITVAFWLLIVHGVVSAAETTVSLELFDLNTQKPINNVLTTITLSSGGKEIVQFSKYVASNVLTIKAEEGRYEVTLRADDLETEGKDYFLKDDLEVGASSSSKVYLYNTGSISGTVIDELSNLISNADLKFECAAEYGEQRPLKTDKYGSFSLQYAPVGRCKITAYRNNMVGAEMITLERGQSSDLVIRLEQKTASRNLLPYAIGMVVFVVLVVVILKRSKMPKSISTEEKKASITHRTRDIIETLREKERQVVQVILDSGNESTQARIKSATGIPKTSLSRILEGLSAKKILEVEIHGKLKKVRLTTWFLGKEN